MTEAPKNWVEIFPFDVAKRINARDVWAGDIATMRSVCVTGMLLGFDGAFVWSEYLDREYPMARN